MARNETYVAKTIRVFLSYSHPNRKCAGRIKAELEDYCLDVFLAYEDIAQSRQWQKIILGYLKRCDVFLPLLTKEFQSSEWADQESGIAFAGDKLIIPLKVSIDPYGFLVMVTAFLALRIAAAVWDLAVPWIFGSPSPLAAGALHARGIAHEVDGR